MHARGRQPAESQDVYSLIAGAPCLDFLNTVGGRRGSQTQDYLRTYSDLVRWSRQAGLLQSDQADRLLQDSAARADDAEAILAQAIVLREALYRIFTGLLDGLPPAPADLAILNIELARTLAHLTVAHIPHEGFAWRWIGTEHALDGVLWPVARSAAELLLSPSVQALRQCAGETCGWLFLDMTKNHSRRWCEMRACGNRAKVRRHRARRRPGGLASGKTPRSR
jgi:predicted RNA-binding Zn ribbon-like protein